MTAPAPRGRDPPAPPAPPGTPRRGAGTSPGFVLGQSLKALSRTSLRLIPEPPHRHPNISPAAPPFRWILFLPAPFTNPAPAGSNSLHRAEPRSHRASCRPGALRRRQELHPTASPGNAARTEKVTPINRDASEDKHCLVKEFFVWNMRFDSPHRCEREPYVSSSSSQSLLTFHYQTRASQGRCIQSHSHTWQAFIQFQTARCLIC